MDYFLNPGSVHQVRWDKPQCLQDTSVSEYLAEVKSDRDCKKIAKEKLWIILTQNIQFYPYKKFGSTQELMKILERVMNEVCWQEMDSAIDYYNRLGITKTVNYLLSCVE